MSDQPRPTVSRSSEQGPYRRFTSTAVRQGRRWLVHCNQHPDVRSNVALLTHAAAHQRFGIAVRLDLLPDEVVVDVLPVLPQDVERHIARMRELRRTASWANRTAATEIRAAARMLADVGLSLRDIGTILGVSHQRAHQLLRDGLLPGDYGEG